jgi:DNA-binding beta-propeller fold protein YncE
MSPLVRNTWIMVTMAITICVTSCSDDPSTSHAPPDTRVPEYHDEYEMNIWDYTVDDENNLHVAQFDDPAIMKYSSDGVLLGRWYAVLSGDTVDVSGLAFAKGHFIALAWGKVLVLDKNYAVVNSWPEHYVRDATGGGDLVDADASGNIYALDDNQNHVAKYGLNGSFKVGWDIAPHDSVNSAWVAGIAVTDAGQVYVAQPGRNRILVYSSGGKLLRTLGKYGTANDEFQWPLGIDIAGNTLYVADSGNFRIKRFTLYGAFLSDLYSIGTYGPNIDVPRSVIADENKIFVMHGRSIVRFDYPE